MLHRHRLPLSRRLQNAQVVFVTAFASESTSANAPVYCRGALRQIQPAAAIPNAVTCDSTALPWPRLMSVGRTQLSCGPYPDVRQATSAPLTRRARRVVYSMLKLQSADRAERITELGCQSQGVVSPNHVNSTRTRPRLDRKVRYEAVL
jgi:hypothetical protein